MKEKKKVYTFSFSQKTHTKLKVKAAKQGKKMSQLLTELIESL